MKKRAVAAFIALVMLLMTMPLSSLAASVPDSWFTAEMNDANVKGLLTANASKNFQREMTRIEFCEIVVRMVEETLGRELELPAVNKFTDTNSEDVLKANQYGIVFGDTETTFSPNKNVTREEIATMMNRAMEGLEHSLGKTLRTAPVSSLTFRDTSSIMGYAVEHVKYAVANDIFRGDNNNNFNPKSNITSQECVAVVVRSFNAMEEKDSYGMSQAQLLLRAADRLHIGYAHGDIQQSVSQNIALPTTAAGGVVISWATSNASVINVSGAVNPTGASVTLTATLTLGGSYRTKTFDLTTTTLTGDQKLIANAKTALELGFYNSADTLDSVTGRVFLPTTVLGLDITWYSDRPSTVSTNGAVNVPNDSSIVTVNLTATFQSGGVSGTKIFTLSVRNPQYAAKTVSLHNIKLGMSLSEVTAVLGTYAGAYTLMSGETWYIYHSSTSYNNFIAVAFRSGKVAGVYTMISSWESYLRDADSSRVLTVAEAKTASNTAIQTFTDTSNSSKAYAAFMYDTTSLIAAERSILAAPTEDFIVELINAYRYLYGSGTGKNTLTADTLLSNSARSHSSEMDSNNYFSVTGLSNSTFQSRAAAAGSNAAVLGGVIAYNSINPFDFLDSMINSSSSSYRSYVLSASAGLVGVGYSGSYTGAYKNLLTVVFSSSSTITSVTSNPSSVSANVGSVADVNLTFLPTNFTESFSVSSSNTSIFTVAAYSTPSTNVRTYRITGVSAGTAYLNVYNSSGSLLLTVAVSITSGTNATAISANSVLVEAGKTYQMSATTLPASGPVVTWSLVTPYSINSAVGYQNSVSGISPSTGVISTTGITGTATARASAPSGTSIPRTADATVYAATVTIPIPNVTLSSGGTHTILSSISCGTVTSGFVISYVSNNPGIASVSSSGVITAIGSGTATITVSVSRSGCVGTIDKTVVVTVQNTQYATSVSINSSSFSLEIGANKQLFATTVPSTVTFGIPSWTSSNIAVATVDSAGIVTAVSEGTALITVTMPAASGTTPASSTVIVTVTKNTPLLTADISTWSLTTGGTVILSNFAKSPIAGLEIIWISNNPSIAYIDSSSGMLVAVAQGTVTLTGYIAAQGSYNQSNNIYVTITVTDPPLSPTPPII